MKDLIETTDPITEITVVVKDVAEETDVTVTARKEEADRDSREETARRMDVPTETRETVITDETITVAMTDRDVNSETETTTEEMTERTTKHSGSCNRRTETTEKECQGKRRSQEERLSS